MKGKTVPGKVGPSGEAARRDGSAVRGLAAERDQRLASDGVHAPAPALGGERRPLLGQHVTADELGRAELLEVLGLGGRGPSRRRTFLPSAASERHGDRAHAAGGAGHHELALGPQRAVVLEREHAQRRGEAGSPDRHRAPGVEALGDAKNGRVLYPRALGEPAPGIDAQAVTGDQDRVAGAEPLSRAGADAAGEVDAGDHRPLADDLAATGEREPVLVVERAVRDVDGDVAGRQRRLLERGALDRRAPVRLLGHQSRERVSHGAGTMAPGGTKLQSEGRKCCSLTLAGTPNASRTEGLLALACRSQGERDRAALGSWGVAERGRFPAERLLAFPGRRAGSAHASAHALVRTERTAGAENTARRPRPLRAVEVPDTSW